MTTYNFTISTAFPNAKVAPDRLAQEIRESSITIAQEGINTSGDTCAVTFKATLSGGDETTLNGLIATHSGDPLPDNTLTKVQQYVSEGVPAPLAADGKPFVLPNSFPGEVLLNFTGVSDKLNPVERFGGDLFGLTKTGVGEETFTVDFLDGVFLAGGHINWDGGSWGSAVYMELIAPATTTKSPAVANQGNCNKVPLGGGVNLIVPAAGNGVYDLDVPVPIPAFDDETNAQNGYWNYSEPWIGKGVMSPCPTLPTPTGKYHLLDVEKELAHFTKLHLFLPTGQRDMIAPAIKPKWILPEWKMKVVISNADANQTLRCGWDLLVARRKSV